jgi:hypothetical protein
MVSGTLVGDYAQLAADAFAKAFDKHIARIHIKKLIFKG